MTTTNANEEKSANIKDFRIESGLEFDPISDTKYLTSTEFGEIVSNIFKQVFVDYEGCTLGGVQGTPYITINFFFNHREISDDAIPSNMFRGITRKIPNKSNNETVNNIRLYNNILRNGDRYYLTDDAKQIIKPFLLSGVGRIYGPNGNINWGNITSEQGDNSQRFNFGVNQVPLQYTVCTFIDPTKLATAIYGEDNTENGAKWCYQVRVANSIPNINSMNNTNSNTANPSNWILAIDRVSAKELNKLAAKFGFANIGNGLGIIR